MTHYQIVVETKAIVGVIVEARNEIEAKKLVENYNTYEFFTKTEPVETLESKPEILHIEVVDLKTPTKKYKKTKNNKK